MPVYLFNVCLYTAPFSLNYFEGEDMKTIKELDYLVGERIRKVLEEKPWHSGVHKLENLFPEETELKEYSIPQLVLITRRYNMLLPTCALCDAVKPNGKWLPREGLVKAMTEGYDKLTHGYCINCLEKENNAFDEQLEKANK